MINDKGLRIFTNNSAFKKGRNFVLALNLRFFLGYPPANSCHCFGAGVKL
jgi:hypothetical protein